MNKIWSILVFTMLSVVSISSCNKDHKTADAVCNCPLNISPEVEKELLDSTSTKKGGKFGIDVEPQLSLGQQASRIIDLDLKVNAGVEFSRESYARTFQKLVDTYPNITRFEIFKREFFCADIKTYCNDPRLEVHEIDSIKHVRLKVLEEVIEKLYLERLQPAQQQLENEDRTNNVSAAKTSRQFALKSKSISISAMAEITRSITACYPVNTTRDCKDCKVLSLELDYTPTKKKLSEHLYEVGMVKVLLSGLSNGEDYVLDFWFEGAGTLDGISKFVEEEAVNQIIDSKEDLCARLSNS